MNPLSPILRPRQFISAEREAGNPSLPKAFIALTLASTFISPIAVFAVYPLFDELRFAGRTVPLNIYGVLWNILLTFFFYMLFQAAEFLFARFLFKGAGDFTQHAYFSSTLSLAFIPVAALLSILGLLAGFLMRFAADPATAYEFIAGAWPLFASYSSICSLFPVLGFGAKIPVWVLDACATFNSPIFLTILLSPLISILLIANSRAHGLSELHGISTMEALLTSILASLLILLAQWLSFTASYTFVAIH